MTSGEVMGRDGVARTALLAVVLLDVVLLALTEVAWLSLQVGSVPLPVSILVAAVTTPLAVRLVDRCFPGSRLVFAPLVVWMVVVVVFGFWSPTGTGTFPPDWRPIVLIAAGLFPGVWVASRPVRPSSEAGSPG
ncbi:hypothetical protein [Actinomycetospora termitidis]|uniref:Integral membrane protein n=1 Tax=Actinomycetospora termitidis TaxID=3053470 RepID=A0ABT7M9K1_9PSEU|nr:hypothetical protein [Actinomycetospora sp. Odt1-22]MDL5157360.1 hypothetical protein [Actinomycetospora sp. Odt1-22]